MSRMENTEPFTLEVLIRDKKARANDNYLYKKVIEAMLDHYVSRKEFAEILLNWEYRVELKLPSIKTIERNRRKITRRPECAWLKPEKVTKARENLEEEFETYSREGK